MLNEELIKEALDKRRNSEGIIYVTRYEMEELDKRRTGEFGLCGIKDMYPDEPSAEFNLCKTLCLHAQGLWNCEGKWYDEEDDRKLARVIKEQVTVDRNTFTMKQLFAFMNLYYMLPVEGSSRKEFEDLFKDKLYAGETYEGGNV